jgi:2-isopropylmalate synthase
MKQIKIFDTTLRDGEQAPGASMNTAEKLRVARSLDELGVDIIEAGFAIASPDDAAAIGEISKIVKSAETCSLSRATEKDIRAAGESLKKAKRSRIHTFLATSEIHLKHKLKISQNECLEKIFAAVKLAKKFAAKVEFSAEDASRTEKEFLKKCFETAIDAGAEILNVPDTVGYAVPDEFGALVKFLIENVRGIENCDLSVHCHDDLGLAVANSLAAVRNGATQIECAVNGIGERAGNCSLEEIAMGIKTRRDFFDTETKIISQKILPISQLVSNLTGFAVPPNKAIVGKNAFAHEAGIHQDGILKHRETYEIMRAEDVGFLKNSLVLGKHSGRAAVAKRFEELGFSLDEKELARIFKKFKNLADRKKSIFDEDLRAILEDFRGRKNEKFSIDLLQISTGNKMRPTATVKIVENETQKFSENCALGTGPVDALCNAIKLATGESDHNLTEFAVKAVTAGIDAVAEVSIKIEKGGRTFTGFAADTDIIFASAKAYLSAVNRGLI